MGPVPLPVGLGRTEADSGTRSPLICTVEALIPLVGAPGCSSSLPTAWRQSSPSAFDVGGDLKGLQQTIEDSERHMKYRQTVLFHRMEVQSSTNISVFS